MSNIYQSRCQQRDDITKLLRGTSVDVLHGAIHHMIQCWRFSPGDLEEALRHAKQCRHWRLAQAAWARYEAAQARAAALPKPPERTAADWTANRDCFEDQTAAFNAWQRHMSDADRLWSTEALK
jgi:hypothetical protein